MLTQFDSNQITMSSREIAELCEKEHRNVKRDFEVMFNGLGLDALNFEHIYFDSMNRQQTEYLLDEELTMTLVTGYNIVLRNRVIKRWKELEQQIEKPQLDLNNPAQLRDLLLGYAQQNIQLSTENQVLSKAIESITQTEHGVKFQQACKILNVKQQELAEWLRKHNWDRYLNNARASTYYSESRSYCETKYSLKEGIKASGQPYSYTQTEFFILPKGMQILAKKFGEAS